MPTPTTSRRRLGHSPMVRPTDQSEAQLLLEVITGAVNPAGITRGRGRLHLPRAAATTSPARRSRSSEPRRHRRVAAQARLPRRDGRRVGAVRSVAPSPAGRHRDRGGRPAPAGRRPRSRAHLPDGDGPVLPRPARRRPADLCRAAGAGADRRGQVTERDGRGRGRCRRDGKWTRTRRSPATSTSTSCSQEDYVRAPLRRHDMPPITDGAVAVVIARRDRARELSTARCSSPASPTAASATTRAFATSTSHRPPVWQPRPPGLRDHRSRWPSSRPPSPTRSCCWPGHSVSVTT